MWNSHRIFLLVGLSLGILWSGCTGLSSKGASDVTDHRSMVGYYSQQAQQLRLDASRADSLAALYEKLAEPDPKSEESQRLAARAKRARAIAQSYLKAAEEAEGLMAEHQRQLPQELRGAEQP